ncbi:MAG: hypothetical protein ACKV2T_34190 [Kofleriaceae bacterium]
MATLRLPVGEMTESADGRVRVSMSLNARTRGAVNSILERLDGVAAEWFWIPTSVDEYEGDLVLDYSPEQSRSMTFAAALPRFVAKPRVYVPELVQLARYLEACIRELERVQVPAVFGPACLRYAPQRTQGAWRLMVVPLVDVTLADWARSSADAWMWTPGRTLLGKKPAHPKGTGSPGSSLADLAAFVVGAALCNALAGDLFPAHLPASARFRRALGGWVGLPQRVHHVVREGLPQSFSDEGTALAALALSLLEPTPPSEWERSLAQVGDQLHPYRTAVRWEYEGNASVARDILERFAATTPKEQVPWDVLGRLRSADQDPSGAVQAAIDALGTPQQRHEGVRELAAEVRRLAHSRPPQEARPLIERAVAAIDALGSRAGDLGRLHFAHIEARYLDRVDAALHRLSAPFEDPWDTIVKSTIQSRLLAGQGHHAHVARICKESKAAIRAMPLGGGELGTYVVAYLDYLDGVAHYGATSQYNDPGYLADAFSRIVSSLDATPGVCDPSDPLIDANVHWLHWIGDLANQMKIEGAKAIRTGIDAYLSSSGLTRRISEQQRRERPPLVWYDAGRLLALSGAP